MGIAHLTRHLAAFSTTTSLGDGHDSSYKTVRDVVVDGPGLVYYVYSILSLHSGSNASLLGVHPSCTEVSEAVMTFLVVLKLSGVNISRIYFDGALPLNKRETRLARLETSRTQLEISRLSHPRGFKSPTIRQQCAAVRFLQVLQNGYDSPKRAILPGNPFMVSAVIEDLKSRWSKSEILAHLPESIISDYKPDETDFPWSEITQIIPGEADTFCAAFAAQDPGVGILTSDSDLFLFHLGQGSVIIYFGSVHAEISEATDCVSRSSINLKATAFCPVSIADRLGIPALSYLAFELNQSPRSKFAELVQRAKNISKAHPKPTRLLNFLEEYETPDLSKFDPYETQILQNMDTRICELFVQGQWTSKYKETDEPPRIYLPFLIEDHSRRCAWADRAVIRRLAYSLLNLKKKISSPASREGTFQIVTECVRRGSRFVFDEIKLFVSEEEVVQEAASLLQGLESFKRRYSLYHKSTSDSELFWRSYALHELNNELFSGQDESRVFRNHVGLKSFLGMNQTNSRDCDNKRAIEWHEIHALAQLQAVLYSLRMVSQIIRVIEPTAGEGLLGLLRSYLYKLPPLRVLMRSYTEVEREFNNTD